MRPPPARAAAAVAGVECLPDPIREAGIRVVVVTQDEPVYAPHYVARILDGLRDRHEVVGVVTLPPAGKRGWGALVRQRLDMYGPVDFVRASALFAARRMSAVLPSAVVGVPGSVRRVAGERGAPVLCVEDVNAPETLGRLRALAPDIVLSVAANQIFEGPLLALPAVTCLNVHSSLLPRYRGIDGLFWALAHGEREVGVTVHVMSRGIDDGGIVAQEAIPVPDGTTLHRLYHRAMEVGARLIAHSIDAYAAGEVRLEPNDPSQGSYHSWPDREAAARFRAQGGRFF